MRYLGLLLFIAISIAACKDENSDQDVTTAAGNNDVLNDTSNYTTVQWLDSLIDFGTVENGEKVDLQFRFRNTGDKPLVITNVSAACGCTVPDYSKEPVMPGKEGFVKAQFNSSGQSPTVHKTVTVSANTMGTQQHVLAFVGEIKNK